MTWTHGSATWADTDPRGHLCGAQTKDKWARLIGPRKDKEGGGVYQA